MTDHTADLEKHRREYAAQWENHANAHHDQGDYAWLAEGVRDYQAILEIGCGAGHSTLELLNQGHRLVVIEENQHCIQLTRQRLEESGYTAEVVLRGHPTAASTYGGKTYDLNYEPVRVFSDVSCVIIEGDALHDEQLIEWLRGRKFDAVICWLIGTHNYRGWCDAVASRGINSSHVYRVIVQNGVYELADEILRKGGILNVVDRMQTPSTDYLQKAVLDLHREQASVTSLQVQGLRYKPFVLSAVEGGVPMVLTLPTDGSAADVTADQSLCAVTSVKP
jgi:precorrin-6B methylase 2